MPWIQPPPEIRRKVESVLGDGFYDQLGQAYARVLLVDPNMRQTQWYRSPADVFKEYAENPDAALYTQHGLGLAVDVTPSSRQIRQRVIEAAGQAGFWVRQYPGKRKLHLAAMADSAWARSPLQAYLRAILSGARRARGG